VGWKRGFVWAGAGRGKKRPTRVSLFSTAWRFLNWAAVLVLFGAFGLISGGYADLNHVLGRFGQSSAPSASKPYYANCAEARRAGAAPIYSWQPGYRAAMDRDGDGVACEPYHRAGR
jgi:Excalibur calcium-binding domain